MKSERKKKAESISRKIIQEYFIDHLKDLSGDFGIISISAVEISGDLSYMDIFLSSIKNQNELTKTLAPHAHDIHRLIAKKIDFIKVPKIRFRYDESIEASSRIYDELKNIRS